MKKISIVLMALALVFGATQCKKKLAQSSTADVKKVDICFSAIGSNNKTDITPGGIVTWSSGDQLHVYGSSAGYLGSITLSSGGGEATGSFSGSINEWSTTQTLYFYYLGINTLASDGSLTIDFSDQREGFNSSKYHVMRCVISEVDPDDTQFSGTMNNMIALGMYDTSDFGDEVTVKVYADYGFKNMIQISSTGELTYGVIGIDSDEFTDNQSGHILTTSNEHCLIALLPIDDWMEDPITMYFTGNDEQGSDEPRRIEANDYYYDDYNSGNPSGIEISASSEGLSKNYVDLAYSGSYFSIDPDDDTRSIKFAIGNLVYDQGRFKMHAEPWGRCFNQEWEAPWQGDVRGYYMVSGTFDLFGWGTAGWNNGSELYQPYTLSATGIYGPGADLTGDYEESDWGVYGFGMDIEKGWRTLTKDEWQWILGPCPEYVTPDPGTNCRESSEVCGVKNARYTRVALGPNIVGSELQYICGLLLFPDKFECPEGVLFNHINFYDYIDYFTEDYYEQPEYWIDDFDLINDADDWEALYKAGAVFLPASGIREGDNIEQPRTLGVYWSSTCDGSSDPYYLANKFWLVDYYAGYGNYGMSVRLVFE